jgi:hypothetical protein
MMKYTAFLLPLCAFICLSVKPVLAQTNPCPVTLEQLPEVRGLKLGMTASEIKHRYPYFTVPEANDYGYSEFSYDFTLERGRYESVGADEKEPFEGIDKKDLANIGLGFLDNKVVALAVSYDQSVEWRNVSEFLDVIIKSLRLPDAAKWKEIDNANEELRCDKYIIRATTKPKHGGSGLGFYQTGIADELKKRETEAKERQRHLFKP